MKRKGLVCESFKMEQDLCEYYGIPLEFRNFVLKAIANARTDEMDDIAFDKVVKDMLWEFRYCYSKHMGWNK